MKRWCHHGGKLIHWGLNKTAEISYTTHSDAFSWIKIYQFPINFHWNVFFEVKSVLWMLMLVQVMAWRYQATSYYRNQEIWMRSHRAGWGHNVVLLGYNNPARFTMEIFVNRESSIQYRQKAIKFDHTEYGNYIRKLKIHENRLLPDRTHHREDLHMGTNSLARCHHSSQQSGYYLGSHTLQTCDWSVNQDASEFPDVMICKGLRVDGFPTLLRWEVISCRRLVYHMIGAGYSYLEMPNCIFT